ncbi:hypothetical protein O3M35_002836 [Rhynocoris fuscipes]|uniref:TATA-binding protein-associated factor 172 n=1 Tax=Rhynocoris fuscipes TaxID=488301 RepID=A0AAW1CST7_9HEMI
MSSRLDRLFLLLDTGSSAVTRRAAANQLGEVQRLYPHELHNLLRTVIPYLRSSSWDTRIAAGWAVEAILAKVPQWNPIANVTAQSTFNDTPGKLNCDTFNVNMILQNSAYLTASEGKEYEVPQQQNSEIVDLNKQRELLNADLGLGAAAQLGFDTNNLYTAEDLKITVKVEEETKRNVAEVVGLSCREVNRAKRKARQAILKQKSKEAASQQQQEDDDEPEKKRSKLLDGSDSYSELSNLPVPDNTNYWPPEVVDWPLDWFCSHLIADLFSPSWEVRHGAATAMRHFIKTQGRSGGKSADIPQAQMEEAHHKWLNDIALKLVCVLSLDRFGDYVCDQVVAPVRETSAQALGSVVNLLPGNHVMSLIKVLLQLIEQKDWETRHGGLLGIKYIFAVRQDLLESLLPISFQAVHGALSDTVDDVGAVAGAALTTAVSLMSSKYVDFGVSVLETLCKLVPEQDDLTPTSTTFVPLLAELLLLPNISQKLRTETLVNNLVLRLWSLLEHNNSSVRLAALKTLSCLPACRQHGLIANSWQSFLQPTLRHLYQRALVEHVPSVHKSVEESWRTVIIGSSLADILVATCPFVTGWLCLAMQSTRVPFENNLLIRAKPLSKETNSKCSKGSGLDYSTSSKCDLKQFIGGSETVLQATREANATHVRITAAKMLGFLSTYIVQPAPGIVYTPEMESPIDSYVKVITVYLDSKSALQRFVTGLVIAEWAITSPPDPPPPQLVSKLLQCLNESVYYDEIGVSYTRLLQDTKDFIASLKHYKIVDDTFNSSILTLDMMEEVIDTKILGLLSNAKLKPKLLESLHDRRKSLHNSICSTLSELNTLHVMTQAATAGALLLLGNLPEKLTPIVKPLMESIKREENEELQTISASRLAYLMEKCFDRNQCPNTKIITNLCNFLRSDPDFTPKIIEMPQNCDIQMKPSHRDSRVNSDVNAEIITLTKHQKTAERAILKRSNSTGCRGPGRPPISEVQLVELLGVEDQAQKNNRILRRGATLALEAITKRFGPKLPAVLPILWQNIVGTLFELVKITDPKEVTWNVKTAGDLIGVLQVLEITTPSIDISLLPQVMSTLPQLIILLSHPYPAVRHMASRCIAVLATVDSLPVMTAIVEKVIPLLSVSNDDNSRRGAVETIAVTMEKMKINIVPYILFLVVPLMGRMSDQKSDIRILATHTFADLIQLMPLDGGVPNPPQLGPQLLSLKATQKEFLEQLFNPSAIGDYKVPVPINAELRSYQQSGVNWLAFLNKYKLHGMLCDDMGLGKTLQSICILAGDHYYRQQKYKETKQEDCAPLPSLVICPPTLTGHWVFEVEKFLSKKYLNPLQYAGPPAERERLMKKQVKKHNLIVASYDIVRKDIDFFSSIHWNYCILDEGHVIKNGKTKSTIAIKQLRANHRLILSGTPIQNNVLELWSLFDFLMPGFLGSEKQFTARYSKPILASRDPKSSTKEQEAGILAMEALHRQVLPFVLRRMKEDVLKDLPPKITQDYYCDLSPLQKQLYEDFSKTQSHQRLSEAADSSHIFQALRYLQSVCNHPKLALTPKHPQYEKILQQLRTQDTDLSDIQHAAKFPALKQLLIDCGIGAPSDQNNTMVVNQHRALIFCQLKAMLDILENDFFKIHMPSVSYLRLDGSVAASLRHSVVTRFNNDPSIDVLILTTQVGGLGLNLTGADTVIFVEHDWSPMKDLQAMDRAHRIGQKKVVNVYRLITRATLEEKIMGLQKFKLMTANTVISAENAHLETMGTDKLLDLFSLDSNAKESNSSSPKKTGNSSSMKALLDTLPELWEHKDYEEEYDLSTFINNLRS